MSLTRPRLTRAPGASLRGRQSEVHRVSRSITATAAGQACVVLIEGSAGLGKSRLLAEGESTARRVGLEVASGRADELHRLSPLAPLLATLHETLPSSGGDKEVETAYALDHDRSRLIDQLADVLQDRAERGPVLISFDDLQWADPPTLLGIQALTQRLSDSPVMWLLSRRRSPSTPELHDLLATLAAGGAMTVELERLPADAVDELATDLLGVAPDGALLALLAKCSGNPFMVTELLRSLADRDELVVDTTCARLLPTGPSGYLYQRLRGGLASISPLTRQLEEVASIFGTSFDLACVARVLHRSVAELLPAVHEALDTDLLVEDGARLAFRHSLVREAAYGALPLSARKTLHREAAAALLAVGHCTTEVAAHVMKGAEVGNAHAVELLVQASDDLVATAPGTAADLRLRSAELMAPTDLDRTRRVGEAIGMLVRAGRGQEAEALGEAALVAGLPTELEALLRLRLAEAFSRGGHPVSALRQTRIALDLPGVDTSTRALLLATKSTAHVLAGDAVAALHAGEETLGTAGARPGIPPGGGEVRGGETLARGRALLTMGVAERMRGRLTRSLELIDQAALLASVDAAVALELEPGWSRGRTLIALDRLDEASAAFDAATRQAAEYESVSSTVLGHTCQAALLLYQGTLPQAIAEGALGLSRAEELVSRTYVPELSAVLAEASAYQGELELARDQLGRGLGLASEGGGSAIAALTWASTTIADASGQEPARVLEIAADLYEYSPLRIQLLATNPVVGPRLVSLALRAEDRRRATIATEMVESLSRTNPRVTSLAAAALQARGLLGRETDRLVAAARSFQAGSRPLARAHACEDAAHALLRDERSTPAVEQLTLALTDYERVGAFHHAQRMRDQLSTLRTPGAPTASRASFGWDSLTGAELRVARLVARGLTNRAIADQLSLSRHTVESHLRHSFHKLDIGSRVELTRIVLRFESTIDT
jgi:DNA-binding CsgD family transcriptional regulator/tetratricopeptide (TPR) repeat protein